MIRSKVDSLRSTLTAIHPAFASEALWQLVRFAIAGLGVTLFSVMIYSVAAVPVRELAGVIAARLEQRAAA